MPHAPRPPGDCRHSSWCRPHSDLSLSLIQRFLPVCRSIPGPHPQTWESSRFHPVCPALCCPHLLGLATTVISDPSLPLPSPNQAALVSGSGGTLSCSPNLCPVWWIASLSSYPKACILRFFHVNLRPPGVLEAKWTGPRLHSYSVCVGRSALGQVNTSLIGVIKTESCSLSQFYPGASLQNQNPLNEGEAGSPWGSTPLHCPKCTLLIFLRALPKETHIQPFTRVTVQGDFRGQDTGFEPMLIPGDPKCHCGSPVRAGAYGGQVMPGL